MLAFPSPLNFNEREFKLVSVPPWSSIIVACLQGIVAITVARSVLSTLAHFFVS